MPSIKTSSLRGQFFTLPSYHQTPSTAYQPWVKTHQDDDSKAFVPVDVCCMLVPLTWYLLTRIMHHAAPPTSHTFLIISHLDLILLKIHNSCSCCAVYEMWNDSPALKFRIYSCRGWWGTASVGGIYCVASGSIIKDENLDRMRRNIPKQKTRGWIERYWFLLFGAMPSTFHTSTSQRVTSDVVNFWTFQVMIPRACLPGASRIQTELTAAFSSQQSREAFILEYDWCCQLLKGEMKANGVWVSAKQF